MARTAGSHARLTGPRIEEAALRLIGRDGSAAVSMRQVAAEVGVQVGALYNYFPDKQQLLARLVFRALDAADAAWAAVPSGGEIGDEIDRLTMAHLDFVLTQPEAAALPQRELQFLAEADRDEAKRRVEARIGRLEEVLRAGRDAGILRVPTSASWPWPCCR